MNWSFRSQLGNLSVLVDVVLRQIPAIFSDSFHQLLDLKDLSRNNRTIFLRRLLSRSSKSSILRRIPPNESTSDASEYLERTAENGICSCIFLQFVLVRPVLSRSPPNEKLDPTENLTTYQNKVKKHFKTQI